MNGREISRHSLKHLIVLTLYEISDGDLKAREPAASSQVSTSSFLMRWGHRTGQKLTAPPWNLTAKQNPQEFLIVHKYSKATNP